MSVEKRPRCGTAKTAHRVAAESLLFEELRNRAGAGTVDFLVSKVYLLLLEDSSA